MGIDSLTGTALFQMERGSTKVNGVETPSDIGVAMLSKQLEVSTDSNMSLIRAMERSVNPNIGGNVDFYA